MGLDIGIAKTNKAPTIQFPLGYSIFSYMPERKDSYSARYGIFLSRKYTLNSLNDLIIGISYHRLSMDVKGTLQQGISPPFYSAHYQYNTQLTQLLAEIKVQHEWHQLFPYVTAGVGSGFNTAKNFHSTVPDYQTITPAFTNHSNSSPSYSLGLGVSTLLLSNATVGIGYLFSDLGQVGLGSGFIRGRTLSNYLNQSH